MKKYIFITLIIYFSSNSASGATKSHIDRIAWARRETIKCILRIEQPVLFAAVLNSGTHQRWVCIPLILAYSDCADECMLESLDTARRYKENMRSVSLQFTGSVKTGWYVLQSDIIYGYKKECDGVKNQFGFITEKAD